MAFSAAPATRQAGTEPLGHRAPCVPQQAPCVPQQAHGSAEVTVSGWGRGWQGVRCPPAPLISAETQHI